MQIGGASIGPGGIEIKQAGLLVRYFDHASIGPGGIEILNTTEMQETVRMLQSDQVELKSAWQEPAGEEPVTLQSDQVELKYE